MRDKDAQVKMYLSQSAKCICHGSYRNKQLTSLTQIPHPTTVCLMCVKDVKVEMYLFQIAKCICLKVQTVFVKAVI